MKRVYPRFEEVLFDKYNIKFKIAFISTRLAKLILNKTLSGDWDIPQIPSIPIENTFNLKGVVPAFTSPSNNTVLFIKSNPGLYEGRLFLKY